MKLIDLPFNPKPSTLMHLDFNSCFATIEQQANPHLRGKPIAVAAYTTPSGCILAPSIEAKSLGITVGMRVKEGKLLCPQLQILSPDPWKYRHVHLSLKKLLGSYTDQIDPKSIDEFVLNLEGYPAFKKGMHTVAEEIKNRIKTEIGEWLTVSIGIGPNRFLSKTAACLKKPNGLEEINSQNFLKIYQSLQLNQLHGIKTQNTSRLHTHGIFSVLDFYHSPVWRLKAAFHAITGYYWYLRLRGWEIDDINTSRKSFGNSYASPKPLVTAKDISPIMMKLVQKMSTRLRRHHYAANGVHFSALFTKGGHWHMGAKTKHSLFSTPDLYRAIFRLYKHCPYPNPITTMAVSCFDLTKNESLQLDLFNQVIKKEKVSQATDKINHRFGEYVITPALMLSTADKVLDRIAFGGMKELIEI